MTSGQPILAKGFSSRKSEWAQCLKTCSWDCPGILQWVPEFDAQHPQKSQALAALGRYRDRYILRAHWPHSIAKWHASGLVRDPALNNPPHPPSSASHPPFLGHQVSTRLGTSSPTEARQVSPLLHIYRGPQTSPCILFGWWLTLWEFPKSPG